MIKAKPYYGPWLDTIPSDAPDGSLWDAVYVFQDGDTLKCQIVAFKGLLIDEDAITVDRDDLEKARRVWPPGSVMPEPRPLVVDPMEGTIQTFGSISHVCVGRQFTDGSYGWTTFLASEFRAFRIGMEGALCYPVQPLNGAMVPVPWPDSGCTTE